MDANAKQDRDLKVWRIDEGRIRKHLDEQVRQTVEETLNGLLEAEADALCKAKRYERSSERQDTLAGHYTRSLQTKAGEMALKVPKLRTLPFASSPFPIAANNQKAAPKYASIYSAHYTPRICRLPPGWGS